MSSYTFTGKPPSLKVFGVAVYSVPHLYAPSEHHCPRCGAVYKIEPITLGSKSGYSWFCPYCASRLGEKRTAEAPDA